MPKGNFVTSFSQRILHSVLERDDIIEAVYPLIAERAHRCFRRRSRFCFEGIGVALA